MTDVDSLPVVFEGQLVEQERFPWLPIFFGQLCQAPDHRGVSRKVSDTETAHIIAEPHVQQRVLAAFLQLLDRFHFRLVRVHENLVHVGELEYARLSVAADGVVQLYNARLLQFFGLPLAEYVRMKQQKEGERSIKK